MACTFRDTASLFLGATVYRKHAMRQRDEGLGIEISQARASHARSRKNWTLQKYRLRLNKSYSLHADRFRRGKKKHPFRPGLTAKTSRPPKTKTHTWYQLSYIHSTTMPLLYSHLIGHILGSLLVFRYFRACLFVRLNLGPLGPRQAPRLQREQDRAKGRRRHARLITPPC